MSYQHIENLYSREAERGDREVTEPFVYPVYITGPPKRESPRLPGSRSLHIQWKGGPCVDVVCGCGKDWHLCETQFMYSLRCPACDRLYHVSDSVEIVEMNAEERASLEKLKADAYGKTNRRDYVPWKWMDQHAEGGVLTKHAPDGSVIEEVTCCPDCYAEWKECECPCLREKLKKLEKENRELRARCGEGAEHAAHAVARLNEGHLGRREPFSKSVDPG